MPLFSETCVGIRADEKGASEQGGVVSRFPSTGPRRKTLLYPPSLPPVLNEVQRSRTLLLRSPRLQTPFETDRGSLMLYISRDLCAMFVAIHANLSQSTRNTRCKSCLCIAIFLQSSLQIMPLFPTPPRLTL